MNGKLFQTLDAKILENPKLREPQQEGFLKVQEHFAVADNAREVGIVLPVGCGKSGLITLCPFAVKANRALVIAPGTNIADQLYKDFLPSNDLMFYAKCEVLEAPPYPEPVEIRGKTTNRDDLDHSDVAVTNIQQLQGEENRWLNSLPPDFFDLILFDEAHHNVAISWDTLRNKFPDAKIINFSATPARADGQLMAGRIIYSFPIHRAMGRGYIKRIKAVVLNPRTLRYVRHEDGQEIVVGLEEVKRLGETEAGFRRSIVSSKETVGTIVDASIRELQKLRRKTGEERLKIIASALNQEHCTQIVQAYREKNMRVDYVHSNINGAANKRVFRKLENHELDVIVQVRMLGEGFDHKYLSVAAVFSVFGNLSPFAQFVGRIMRVIKEQAARDPINQGTVIFHAGSNVAKVWGDFREFSEADQDYFDQLLPTEDWHYGDDEEHEIEPTNPLPAEPSTIEIRNQDVVTLEEIPLLQRDEEARRAVQYLIDHGLTAEDYQREHELRRITTTRFEAKKAARPALDARVKNAAGRELQARGVNPEGKDLDKQRRNRTNFVVLKSAIDKKISDRLGHKSGDRPEFTVDQYSEIDRCLSDLVQEACQEVFGG